MGLVCRYLFVLLPYFPAQRALPLNVLPTTLCRYQCIHTNFGDHASTQVDVGEMTPRQVHTASFLRLGLSIRNSLILVAWAGIREDSMVKLPCSAMLLNCRSAPATRLDLIHKRKWLGLAGRSKPLWRSSTIRAGVAMCFPAAADFDPNCCRYAAKVLEFSTKEGGKATADIKNDVSDSVEIDVDGKKSSIPAKRQ